VARACIFAPAPILTVTIEHTDGDELHLHAGGQGIWIGRLMAELGVEVTVSASFGGETGQVVRCLLADGDVALVETRAAAANGAYVHDRRSGDRRELAAVASGPLARHDVDELYGATVTAALGADVCVLGGPGGDDIVPADVYRRLTSDLVANGGTVVADLSGRLLDAVIEGRAPVVKVSHEELLADGRASGDSGDELFAAIAAIAAETGGSAVCTRAGDSALAVVEGRFLDVASPPLEPVESRGAGDSFTAGLAAGVARGLPIEDALRLAAAAGSLNVTRRGLGSGRREQVEALVEHVAVQEVERSGRGGRRCGP
jgi:1-phosphofructokinase